MWKQLWDYSKQLITLTRDVQQNKEALKEIRQDKKEDRQEIKELNERVDRLTEIVQRLAFELQRQNDKFEASQKMALLETENMILRSGRGLLSGDSPGEAKISELLAVIEALKQENEALRRQVDQKEGDGSA